VHGSETKERGVLLWGKAENLDKLWWLSNCHVGQHMEWCAEEGELWGETGNCMEERDVMACGCSHTPKYFSLRQRAVNTYTSFIWRTVCAVIYNSLRYQCGFIYDSCKIVRSAVRYQWDLRNSKFWGIFTPQSPSYTNWLTDIQTIFICSLLACNTALFGSR
jgi:hypothetical protein